MSLDESQRVAQRPFRLQPRIQSYSWGSRTALAGLRGESTPSEEPQAEMWMGAHDLAPSLVETEAGTEPLTELIAQDPKGLLGPRVIERFGERLPFLFKILAAEMPLSLQAHPSQVQAEEGYERENKLGIAINSGERNYRDPSHKPELVCALSPFDALYGFRRRDESQSLLKLAGLDELAALLDGPKAMPAILELFTHLLRAPEDRGQDLAERAATAAVRHRGDLAFNWVMALFTQFPGDPMCIAPLFLNVVHLEPGESLFTEAGILHSYLSGTAIEIMANSDNVVRAGLTSKHVDSGELLRVLTFSEVDATVRSGRCREVPGGRCWSYDSPAPEFHLLRIELDGRMISGGSDSVEILVCTSGTCRVRRVDGSPEKAVEISSGECVLVPWSVGDYVLDGKANLYVAAVP